MISVPGKACMLPRNLALFCYRYKPLHIRDISDATQSALKRRAARHRRSLQKEVQVLLEEAARMQADVDQDPSRLQLRTVHTGGDGHWGRESQPR
jgi:plasmid stability protein